MNVYEIQAFAYSDFEHYILLHEKSFSKIEFRKMVEIARRKCKERCDSSFDTFLNAYYPRDVIEVLKQEFGFVESDHLVAYVGCDYDSVCEVDLE